MIGTAGVEQQSDFGLAFCSTSDFFGYTLGFLVLVHCLDRRDENALSVIQDFLSSIQVLAATARGKPSGPMANRATC